MRKQTPQRRLGLWGGVVGGVIAAWASAWPGLPSPAGEGGPGAPIMHWVSLRQPEPGAARPPREGPVEAVVVMDDGTRYTGMLRESSPAPGQEADAEILLEIGGVVMRLRSSDVARVDILPPVLERYQRLRASIADDDIPALLTLVEWLVHRKEYSAASEELLGVRRQEPRHPRALELDRLIEAQRALDAGTPAGNQPREDADTQTREPDERARSGEPFPVLTAEEINLIRVYELDLNRLPRIIIRRETVERLMEEYLGDPLIPSTAEGREDLLRTARSNPRRVLEIIFRLRARHLYGEIQVLDNPRALQLFRDQVHRTWLINGCASCHNTEPDAPRGPRLITRRPNSDATVYSNFLILERYRLADGTPLINYDEPAKSPLLQLGMPRANVEWAHPDVRDARGWSPVFLGEASGSYQKAITWIRSMYRPRPDYPIEYPPVPENAAPPDSPVER